jgi:hypothetical protein
MAINSFDFVISFEIHRQRSILTIIVFMLAYWDVHVFDMVRKNFSRCIIAASTFIFQNTRSQFFVMGTLSL